MYVKTLCCHGAFNQLPYDGFLQEAPENHLKWPTLLVPENSKWSDLLGLDSFILLIQMLGPWKTYLLEFIVISAQDGVHENTKL